MKLLLVTARWLALSSVIAVSGIAAAAEGIASLPTPVNPQAQAQAIQQYWTPERMANAQPRPIPTVIVAPGAAPAAAPVITGPPTTVDGWLPEMGPYVPTVRTYPVSTRQALAAPQAFGTPPTNPRDGPYGPFQRWAMEGTYLGGFRRIHGKLFFSIGAGNFVCSGSVIGRSTVATAGHCISNGAGTFATNVLFCPSYFNNPTGPNPARGCWAMTTGAVPNEWHLSGQPDYDYACIVTATTGTVVANKIGNVTGWAGRAFNWASQQPVITFGYPAAAPFQGNTIQMTSSVEWYNWDPAPGGQVSKVIGSDLTGGSSGGGWFLGWRHPAAEIGDTDSNVATDPYGIDGPYINGVNSHKRCVVNCNNPPSTTQGVFWQEMTSPPFLGGGSVDSEAVFGACLAHANNNP